MGKLLENLKEYFQNTDKEQIEKDWDEIKKYNKICPDIFEYFNFIKNNGNIVIVIIPDHGIDNTYYFNRIYDKDKYINKNTTFEYDNYLISSEFANYLYTYFKKAYSIDQLKYSSVDFIDNSDIENIDF